MGVKRVVEDCLFESLTMQQWAARVEGVCNRMIPLNSYYGSQLFEAVREVVLENLFYTLVFHLSLSFPIMRVDI